MHPRSHSDTLPPLRDRVSQACDTCKQRKVKCDGQAPCSYCKRRKRAQSCHFSPPVIRRRRTTTRASASARVSPNPPEPAVPSSHIRNFTPVPTDNTPSITPATTTTATIVTTAPSPVLTRHSDAVSAAEEEAEVPRDARLICDAQGRRVFIGDCAPLSLFQTVRQIVTARVDPHAFAPETSRVSMLENVTSEELVPLGPVGDPLIDQSAVQRLVVTYLAVTSGLVDLFDNTQLVADISAWAGHHAKRTADVTSAVNYLVLAIGSQSEDEQIATRYFLRGKHLALAALAGNLSLGTVQSFLLTTLYMLRSCQINAAFLFFGIAARAAYAIGLHRTEVNSRFGPEIHVRRDCLWKSVRVLDLYLSISMGRPPAAADADCTVPYTSTGSDGSGVERYDLLNASVQILSIVEGIVLEVYSRRKISLQLTEGISRQLREWSGKWLAPLLRAVQTTRERAGGDDTPTARHTHSSDDDRNVGNGGSRGSETGISRKYESTGAVQVLSSYYYAVMLVSRPFLMYGLCKRLPKNTSTSAHFRSTTAAEGHDGECACKSSSGRAKLANACIDAATLMVGTITEFIEQGPPDSRMPVIVSWLFASALVLGVGLLGDFGRALEMPLRASVLALAHFGRHDAHASQYERIAESLRLCALSHLSRRDEEDRRRIAEESTQLFGLVPRNPLEENRREHQEGRGGDQQQSGRYVERDADGRVDATTIPEVTVPASHNHGYERENDHVDNSFPRTSNVRNTNNAPTTAATTNNNNNNNNGTIPPNRGENPRSWEAPTEPFSDFDASIFSFGACVHQTHTQPYPHPHPQSQSQIQSHSHLHPHPQALLAQGDFPGDISNSSTSGIHDTADQVFGAMNLFPLLDGNGHIDLAHLL